MDSNDNSKEEENDFHWLQQGNESNNEDQKNNLSNSNLNKDNFNPISLLKSDLISHKNQSNEENNLIDELSKLNLGNKGNSKDLAFNYYFGAGNNNENKNLMLQKNPNERKIIMNNPIQGSRFIGMNMMNNNQNEDDYNKNIENNSNDNNDLINLNMGNFQGKLNDKIENNPNFNNNNFILSQPYIPKKQRYNIQMNDNLNNNNSFNNNNTNNNKLNFNPLNDMNLTNQIQNQNLNTINEKIPAKFFVIKSIDEANIIRSINFKIWCSTIKGNQKLQKAFKESEKKYPIYLFFSVNGSGKFMGVAQMVSDVEYRVNFNYWSQNDKWKGFFFVNWIFIKDIPNRIFRQIINEYNDNKPVTSSRDTQEIYPSAGMRMLKIFKEYPQESSIFDNMNMEEKMMIYQQQQNKNNNQRQQINFGMGINNMSNLNNNLNMNNMNLNMNNMNNLNNLNNINNMNNMNNLNNMNLNNMNLNSMNNMMNYNKMNLSQQQMMMMMQQRKQQMLNMNNAQENNF